MEPFHDRLLRDFGNPPVIEVVLSAQFDPIKGLRGPQTGLLWQKFRDRFPKFEEHPPLEPVIESFGITRAKNVNLKFELIEGVPEIRTWFLSDRGDKLIQVQQDRFIHNWRKVTDKDEYPRYGHVVSTFAKELAVFRDFIDEERLGELFFNQCEVTYVNHIVSGEGWSGHGQIDKVLRAWKEVDKEAFLQEPEDLRLAIRYIIPDDQNKPIGRLHISAVPLFRVSDNKPLLALTLTARCKPEGRGIEGLIESLNKAHEWVVRGFASATTPGMHEIWERCDGR